MREQTVSRFCQQDATGDIRRLLIVKFIVWLCDTVSYIHPVLFAPVLSMQDDRDAFYVCDLGDVLKKHLRWARALPRVTPFYAVKCNDSRAVVMTLASLGTGFDCASKVKKAFHCGCGGVLGTQGTAVPAIS